MQNLVLIAAAGGLALLFAWLVGRNAELLGNRLGLLDFPDVHGGRKRHERVTPLVGGMAVIVPVIAATLFMQQWMDDVAPPAATHLGWFAFAVGAMALIGLADDRFGLSPRVRLVLAVIVLALVVNFAPDFSLSFLRFTGSDELIFLGRLGVVFALVCLVGLLNAVNMADGKNGLVIGMSLIWTAALALHAPAVLQPVLAAAFAALAVTFVFNMRGRLFLGDGGSYGLSAVFGLLAIYIYNHAFVALRADSIAVLFAIPVFDTVRLITVRVARGRSPFSADRDHLHHHLAYRWGWPKGLVVYLALVILPNLGAILWPAGAPLWLASAFAAYVAVLFHATRHGHFTSEALR